MPRKPATEEQRQAVRQSIQKAAADVYRADGLAGVTARAIASKAGVSVGTLYTYFGNLPALMQTLWQEPLKTVNERFIIAAENARTPLEQIAALFDAYLEFALRNRELYRGAFLFVRPENLPRSEPMQMREQVFPSLLIQALEAGQAAGDIRAGSPELQAQLIWSGLHGCLALPQNLERFRLSQEREVAEQMKAALLQNLRA